MSYQNIETLIAIRPLPPVASAVFALAVTILKWEQRRQTRRALSHLDKHMLSDIGLNQHEAEMEHQKAFWKG
jgi:uncharacterized protein YjiS (DUF1127 family)